jgi:hypothetical protein
MNPISSRGQNKGFPAIAVLRLTANKPVAPAADRSAQADDVILAAVEHPPRIGQTRPISALLPEVLARYGLAQPNTTATEFTGAFDVMA